MRRQKETAADCAASLDVLAHRLGISRSTAKNLRRDGLCRNEGGYSLSQAEELLRRRSLRVAHLKGLSQEAMDSKQRKLSADASMAELKYEQARGELILRDKVQQEWRCALVALKSRFLGLGRELAPRLTGCGPMQIQAAIDGRIFEILRLLANQKYYPIETLQQDLNLGTSPSN
jgi:biotin operon repressor